MTIAAGKIGKHEFHLYREAPSGKGKPLLEYAREGNDMWLWIRNYELIVSRLEKRR